MLSDILKKITLVRYRNDFWIWTPDSTKTFSIGSCYKHLVSTDMNGGLNRDFSNVFNELWVTSIPSKILNFGWRVFTNSLPSRDVLLRHKVIIYEEDAGCLFLQGIA